MRDAVVRANREYGRMSREAVLERMAERDSEWAGAGEGSTLVRDVLEHPAARVLTAHAGRDPAAYGEIFVTDRHGAAVASTTKLSDYYQGDEGDWQAAYRRGRGRVWVEDRVRGEPTKGSRFVVELERGGG